MFEFDTPTNLILGLVTGLVFGFLLQRGGVTRYRVILGQFLWVDHTVLRTMLTAVVVGSAGGASGSRCRSCNWPSTPPS